MTLSSTRFFAASPTMRIVEMSFVGLLFGLVLAACSSGGNQARTAVPQPSSTSSQVPPSLVPSAETRETIERVAAFMASRDTTGLTALAKAEDIRCDDQIEAPYPLCKGAAPSTIRQGFRVAQHGGEGSAVDEQGLRALLVSAAAARPRLASFGCGVGSPNCDRLFVVFENPSGSIQQAFYIFLQGDDIAMTISGVGMSGDNAEILLNGGESKTPWGDARFTPYVSTR